MASSWTGQQRGGVAGHWIFHKLLDWIGRDLAGWLLYPVAWYFTLTAPRGVTASRDYLRQAGRYWQWPGIPSTYSHFLAFSQVLLDRAALLSGTGGVYTFEFDGENHIHDALKQGRGLLMISAHIGNWEAAGRALKDRIPAPIRVAMVQAEAQRLAGFLGKKQDRGYSVLPLTADEESGLAILASLRQGEIVAMHADRFLPGARGRRFEFLGRPAAFPEGPFQIAAVAGCPVLTCFAIRTGSRSYKLKGFPAETIAAPRAGRSQAVEAAMRQYVARLEAMVKQYPSQWFNFYPFWDSMTA